MNTKLSTNRKLSRMFANILSIFVILTMLFANTGFSVRAAQRTLPGDWDGNAVRKASVLHDEGGYKMWYDGVNFFDQTQIGLATSDDGTSWVKYSDNPVLTGGTEAWDSSGEHAPFVMKDGGLYKMWYEGYDGNVRQLGYATSPDGITWTKYEGNPVLQAGPEGYDQDVAGHGSVLYDDGMYKLWYHAIGDQGIIIAYATSPDGIHWTKEGPVLLQETGVWDEGGLWGPSVLKVDDTYWMWYSAGSPIYPASIGAATSTDGVDWTRVGDAPVITIVDNHLGDPHVIFDAGIFKMWFNNFSDGAIYYAESYDGINWSTPGSALNPGVLFPLEGWHDGSYGEVDPGACVAFGWSADPDDRDRDVQIRILSDGDEVATTTASDYGEDMEQYGICPGGTCRFTVNLWDLISHDEEHEITVQAYDGETADWWNLEGTPKSLTCLTPPPPTPWLIAFPENGAVEGWEWPEGATVSLSINGITDPDWSGVAHVSDWGDPRTYVRIEFWEDYNLQIGDQVTLTDEFGQTTTHTVQNLAVTQANGDTDTVSGTANIGAIVQVWPHGTDYFIEDTVEDGTWIANFGALGFHEIEQTGGRSQIVVDGNATAVDWHVTYPRFTVFPEWEWFDGLDWPNGATVTITVEGKEAVCTTEGTSWNYFFNGGFPAGCDVVVGDVVTFSYGETLRTHTVQNLAITKVNQEDDIVQGTADAGAEIHVWPHATGQEQLAITTPQGKWNVDFTGIYDIMLGDGGRAEIRDEMGNATAADWYIPNPRLIAFPAVDQIFGYGWPYGSRVNLNINGKHIAGTYVQGAPWDPNDIMAFFDFGDLHDLVAGDVVTLSGRDMEINYTVQNLTVIEANADANTVSGASDPYETVYVWQHEPGPQLPFQANEDGEWLADLSGYYDIYPGSSGRSEIRDEFGNSTAVDWRSPNIRFTVFPEWNYLEGYEWPDGASVTISVAGKENCLTGAVAVFPEWDPWNTFFSVNFPEGCAIEAGDFVTLSFESFELTHHVQELAITEVSLDENTVAGTADFDPEQYDLHTWIHGVDGSYMQLSVEDGSWVAHFGLDLQPGMGGRVELTDQASNSTAMDWHIPSPNLIAFPAVDQIFGYNWPEGSEVSLAINAEDIATATVQGAPWDANDIMAFFDFGGAHNLVAGDVVTLSGSGRELTYTVQNLSVTEAEADANTVAGTADNGALVYAGVHEWWDVTEMQLTATGGKWLADFDSRNFDLQAGMCGRAEIRDELGSRTAVDWCIPNPRIVASITEDWFYVQEFAPSTELAFAVYASQSGTLIWEGTTPPTDGSGFVWINADGRWNLEPGNYLVVKDGTITKDLIIEGFTFDFFNVSNGQLSGTAPEPYGRRVWVGIGWENAGWSMDVATNDTAAWLADFGQPVPNDYRWVAAQIFDGDGDASELRPASQIIFLRPRCGDTYTAQANIPLEIRYGSWLAKGEELAIQNAEHLTVTLVLDGVPVTGVQQPVVPGSEIPCGASAEAYGVFYVTQVGPLSPGTHIASVTWSFDEQVTDGGDVDGDGVLDLYGPGVIGTGEFTIIVP